VLKISSRDLYTSLHYDERNFINTSLFVLDKSRKYHSRILSLQRTLNYVTGSLKSALCLHMGMTPMGEIAVSICPNTLDILGLEYLTSLNLPTLKSQFLHVVNLTLLTMVEMNCD